MCSSDLFASEPNIFWGEIIIHEIRIPSVVESDPIINNVIIGKPAFFIETRFTSRSKKNIEIGAIYSKIIEYNLIVFEADGISLRLAIIAVNNITKRAEPNCFPKFVLPTYNDKIIIKQSIRRT